MKFDLLIAVLIYIFILFPRFKQDDFLVALLKTIFYAYLVMVIYETLMPISTNLLHIFESDYRSMNLNPFIDVIENHNSAIEDVLLNIFMFIPFGMLYPELFKKDFKSCVKDAFLLSLCIELLQPMLSSFRASDITDVITNTSGACIGYAIYYQYKTQLNLCLKKKDLEKKKEA